MELSNYTVYRFYQSGSRPRIRRKGFTLRQAQEHCSDPETSSRTATKACNGNPEAIERWNKKQKHWFEGYSDK